MPVWGGDSSNHAFSWTQAGGIVDLGTLGGPYSYALAVNASGQVVGSSDTTAGGWPTRSTHAFSWTQAGGMVDLGTFGGSWSHAWDVNDSGMVVGYAYTSGNISTHAFSWTQAGGMVDLGTLGGSYSNALAVNASGQVVGFSYTAGDNSVHAFSWTQAGGMIDLGPLGSGDQGYQVTVNDSGQVVGERSGRAFSWTQAGGTVDLGTIGGARSEPCALNALGQVVGWSSTAGENGAHAFSWTQAGGMIDLNLHIPNAPAGLELIYGLAVSDNGSIVAWSTAGTVLLGGSSTVPVLGPISANDPVAAGSPVSVSANFTDADTTDTHTAVWQWGDATPDSSGTVSETNGSGTASQSHSFSAAGIYSSSLTITDSTGRTAKVNRDIVVYDPSAGFVTGGGWILSPQGAYKADETLVGRATFGFVSKYQQGAKVPIGNTEFQFQAARLNFRSDTCDWLVVAGARAQYKGIGTINGSGSYKFMLTAIDGQISGGGGIDRFRIKIWHYDATSEKDVVDYDNQTDASLTGGLSEGTKLGGGSIVIHMQ